MPKQTSDFFAALVRNAREAGLAAGNAAAVRPMVVQQHVNQLDDRSAVAQQWIVPDGPCGFAWVHVKGNTPFGRWAKAKGIARPDYTTGLAISCHDFNQSMMRKSAYARAFAAVLKDAGIVAYAQDRMD